jgi:hypothetical protein
MKSLIAVFGLIGLIVVLVIAGPLLLIWALNTLFPVLAIPYTGWTWLAALIIGGVISPTVKIRR